jgi:hypothetical protein
VAATDPIPSPRGPVRVGPLSPVPFNARKCIMQPNCLFLPHSLLSPFCVCLIFYIACSSACKCTFVELSSLYY